MLDPEAVTPEKYAAEVVKEILRAEPRAWFWYGPTTLIVRWGDMLLPRTFWVHRGGPIP
jgi:1-acylglycerone phosphate reductase